MYVRFMSSGPIEVAQHQVLAGLADVDRGLAAVLGGSRWSMSARDVRTVLAEVTRLQAVAHTAYLVLLVESAGRDAPEQGRTTNATCTWLAAQRNLSAGQLQADLRSAQVLDAEVGELRTLGRALACGEVSAAHTRIAVRALEQIPAGIRRERTVEIDGLLTDQARRFAPPTTAKLARHLLDTVDPDRVDRFDTEAHLRREVFLAVDSTGMGVLRAQLEPTVTAQFKAVLEHLSAPHRGAVQSWQDEAEPSALAGSAPAGSAHTDAAVVDRRTPAQRRADALGEMARLAAGALHIGVRAGEPPRVVVHTTPEQIAAAHGVRDGAQAAQQPAAGAASCEQTGPLTPTTLDLLLCDSVIDRVLLDDTGRVLEMTTLGRFFTPAQRRALAARDGGCAFPGCDRPPTWTDAHHIEFFSRGGPTTVDNGVLLCAHHHTVIHLGEWSISSRGGVPWFLPPAHLDPQQRPIRNTVHDAIAETRRVGQQLSLPTAHVATDPGG